MQATFQEQHSRINTLVQRWDRRYRWQQTIYWLPVSLLPGLIAGLVLLVAARLVPLPPATQLLVVAAVIVGLGLAAMLGIVWLRPRPVLDSARRFDLEFDLGERISTALELLEGRIQAADDLAGHQIDDAWSQGQTVNARDRMPLRWNRGAWGTALVAVAALLLLLILPNAQGSANDSLAADRGVIDESVDTVERITEEIAADSVLPEDERQQLLQQLEQTSEVLQEDEVTPEEAFASLSDAETQLEEQANQLNRETRQQQEALQQASQALQQNQANNPVEPGSPGSGEQGIEQSLQEMQQSLQDMEQQQAEQLADALERAADALEATNPEAAAALREAAEALRNGDQQAAQEAMQDAAQSLQQQQQQTEQQQQSADQLQQQSQQLQQAADQIAQQGQQQQNGQQQQQQQQAADEGVQDLQENQQSGEQQGQQPGQEQGGEQSGQRGGEQSGEQSSQQSGQSGQVQSQQSQPQQGQPGEGENQGQQGAQAGGAGDQPGDAGSEDAAAGSQPASQDNAPDGQGEGDFASVYAPRRIGGEGGPEVFLEPETSDVPVTEGEFAENPAGESLVPYNQVFSDYSNAANRALESDYIPLGLRDVVHDYFTSIEPGQ